MSDLATTEPAALSEAQRDAILRHLNLNPADVNTQALLLICQRYDLDPLLKHVVLIQGRPYVTRDGYLAVAHRSGELDGIEITDQGEDDSHWWAKVSVYRKDMSHAFTYTGRFPKAEARHMAKYGPEMAIKCGEVMALRRAFNVTGIGAADEQWETHAPPVFDWEALGWADQAEHDAARAQNGERSRSLPDDLQAELKGWLEDQGWKLPYERGQMDAWADRIDALMGDQASGGGAAPSGEDGDPAAGLPSFLGWGPPPRQLVTVDECRSDVQP